MKYHRAVSQKSINCDRLCPYSSLNLRQLISVQASTPTRVKIRAPNNLSVDSKGARAIKTNVENKNQSHQFDWKRLLIFFVLFFYFPIAIIMILWLLCIKRQPG